MIHRSIFGTLLLVAVLVSGSAAAQEGQQQQEQPAAQNQQADPRWTAPAWRGPGWWDARVYQVDVAMVRVAHLSPNTPAVDVTIAWPDEWWATTEEEPATPAEEEFAEGATTLEGLEYQQVTDYVMVPAGAHRISLNDPEGDQVALQEMEIDLNADAYYTIAAVGFVLGTDEELDARVRQEQEEGDEGFFTWLEGLFTVDGRDADDLSLRLEVYDDRPGAVPGAGWANVRTINAAAGSPDIDVRTSVVQPDDGAGAPDPAAAPGAAPPPPAPARTQQFQLANELSFPRASDYEGVRTIGYDVEVLDLATNETILGFSGDELAPGAVYTIMITGTAVADFPVEAIVLEDVRIVNRQLEEGPAGDAAQEGGDGQD